MAEERHTEMSKWRLERDWADGSMSCQKANLEYTIVDEEGGYIADVLGKEEGEIIIQACNSHAALVEALEIVKDRINEYADADVPDKHLLWEMYGILQAALALAKKVDENG